MRTSFLMVNFFLRAVSRVEDKKRKAAKRKAEKEKEKEEEANKTGEVEGVNQVEGLVIIFSYVKFKAIYFI